MHPEVEEEAEIREMEDRLDPQRDFEQRRPELDIPPPPQLEGLHTPHAPDHVPWIDVLAQISSLGTRMEELALVHDSRFYFMEEHMDQCQTGVTSWFDHFQQRFEHIEERMDQQQATFEHLQQSIDRIESH
ncbi:hypothetical protein CK203_017259 [Vitis vinifera]|uniref:Uncharacterized protein n=1 Tax=Vitis vinifera TaxID=29760 RepID=A0A438JZI2_VITVI|nr:hypothetical protein CK203_017259 [Vitis vinifera]